MLVVGVLCGLVAGARGTWAEQGREGRASKKKGELRVAAAADLTAVMPVVAEAYEKATGVKLVVSYGSSSALVTQIKNGAPVDVFLGADFSFPELVVAAGLADAGAPVQYGTGKLVVWARKDSPLEPLTQASLSDPRVKRVAIADELRAPYGRAAVQALKRMGIYEAIKPKLATAENVAQAAQFVESGNADLGLISETLADSAHMKEVGTYVVVPPMIYLEIQQTAVVLKRSGRRAEAHAFLNWLRSKPVQEELGKMGLGPVR